MNDSGSVDNGLSLFTETPSVQTHLGLIQSVIVRMAANSAAVKTWCVTIVSAILVVAAENNKPEYICIALLPVIAFCFLDAYYLALEKAFRKSYEEFIKKYHDDSLTKADYYIVKPACGVWCCFFKSLISFSVCVFYAIIIIAILLIWKLLI